MPTAETLHQRYFVAMWSDIDRWVIPTSALMGGQLPKGWITANIGELVQLVTDRIQVNPEGEFKMAGVRLYGEGVFHRETVSGGKMSAKYVAPLKSGALIYNRLFAWKSSFAIVPTELADCHVSNEFPQFLPNPSKLVPEFLYLWSLTAQTIRAVNAASTGSAAVSRNRFREEFFLEFEIPLPPLAEQQKIVSAWRQTRAEVSDIRKQIAELEEKIEIDFLADLGLTKPKHAALPKIFSVRWKDLERWSVMFNQLASVNVDMATGRFPAVSLQECIQDTMNGYCIRPVTRETPHRMLKLNALQPGGLDLAASKFVEVSDKIAGRFHIAKGDLLICRSVGSFSHVAKCALVEENRPDILFPDIIIRARFNDRIVPAYAREVIQSSAGRAWFQQNARTAVGMWKIGGSDIASFPMPLPSLSVQRDLVNKVTSQRKIITALKAKANQKTAQSKADLEAMILGAKSVPENA